MEIKLPAGTKRAIVIYEDENGMPGTETQGEFNNMYHMQSVLMQALLSMQANMTAQAVLANLYGGDADAQDAPA